MVETAIGMTNLGFIFYMRDVHGLAPGVVGWFAATWLICYVGGCLLLRLVIGRLKPRYCMLASTASMAALVLAVLLSPNIPLSFFLYGAYGLALSLFWPPLMGWISFGMEGRELGRAMARLTIVGTVGIVLGPFLAGILSEVAPALPVICAVILYSLTMVLISGASLFLPRIRGDSQDDANSGGDTQMAGRSTMLRYPAWIGLFGTCVVLGLVLNIFPMYARIDLGIDKGTVGILLLTRALGAGLGYVLMGRISFWHFKPVPMISGVAAVALAILLLPWIKSVILLLLLMFSLGPLHAVAFSYSFFHGATGSDKRSQRMAIHEALLAGGIITGSTVGGMLYQRFPMVTVSLVCAALVVIIIAIQIFLSVRAGYLDRARFGQGPCDQCQKKGIGVQTSPKLKTTKGPMTCEKIL